MTARKLTNPLFDVKRAKIKNLKTVWVDTQVQQQILQDSFKEAYPEDLSGSERLENAINSIRSLFGEKSGGNYEE